MGEKFRLDRFLAECGQGTRSEVKNYIKKGKVTVNGAVCKDNSSKIDTDVDVVCLNGEELFYEKYRYFMLNKPAGCVSATRDGISQTVLDLLDGEITDGLFPVGRLDKDTEGFLLITNDGALGHNLLSPKKHIDKKYLACVDVSLDEEQMRLFAEGIDIGDEKITMPAEIEYIDEADGLFQYEVILREGRYHQVKRMFEYFGSKVVYLKRLSMGNVVLDDELEPGEYRRLTDEELKSLQGR